MSPGEGSKGYTVLDIAELIRPAAAGGVEKYYRHTIRTRGGTVLTVDVDPGNFTPEKVKPILTEAATNADLIKQG